MLSYNYSSIIDGNLKKCSIACNTLKKNQAIFTSLKTKHILWQSQPILALFSVSQGSFSSMTLLKFSTNEIGSCMIVFVIFFCSKNLLFLY